MNLLLRPIFEPTAEQSLIRYRRRRGFDYTTDDEEIMVMILAIEEGKRR